MERFAQRNAELNSWTKANLTRNYEDGILRTDPKKEDFRKYLERNGIIDALTKGRSSINFANFLVLVGLYEEPEKPDSPVDYIKQFLGGPSDVDTEQLRHENEELKNRIEELQAKLDQLTASNEEKPVEATAAQ